MKNKASVFLKQIVALLSSITKAKSMAIKNKTSAVKARLVMFSVMKSKKVLLGSITDKIHAVLGHIDDENSDSDDEDDGCKAIVLYNNNYNGSANEYLSCSCIQLAEEMDEEQEDDKYPDLTHSLFDGEEEFNDPGGSIIDLVKNSKEEGEDFRLEDEIDHVADLFIKRFHKQMRLQKLESFKRFQEMLARSV